MIDVTKASRETKDRVVAAYAEWREARLEPGALPVAQELDRAWQQLRAECAAPKLRSREQVDAEIAAAVRAYHKAWYDAPNMTRIGFDAWKTVEVDQLNRLCAEPTAEEPAEPPSKLDPVTRWARRVAEHVADECDNDAGNYDGSDSTIHALDQYIKAVTGRPTSEPAELDLAEHEVCSCEEAEGLKARVAELEERIEKQRLAIDALNESRRKVLAAMWRT